MSTTPTSTLWLKRPEPCPTYICTLPDFGVQVRFISRRPYANLETRRLRDDGSPDPSGLWREATEPEPGFLEAVARAFDLPPLEVA